MQIVDLLRDRLRRAAGAMALLAAALPTVAAATAGDIGLYASDVTVAQGNWAAVASASGAGGMKMLSTDAGWSTTNAPRAAPADYFEVSFSAPSDVRYHVWLRLRATADSKYNDSVWVQFSDAVDATLSRVYPIGSTTGLLVNLENCSGCGVSGSGWQDRGYWLQQSAVVQFAAGGSHTMRVQTREDGVQVDQIVLSPSAYMTTSPGQFTNDATIVSKSPSIPPTPLSTPFTGTAAAIPGTIQAEEFDNGSDGVAYHDLTAANAGGAFRQTDVDIEPASAGGYDVGWIAAGEWLQYTVNVAANASYTAQFVVASNGQGGTFHLEMNGANVTGPLTIPNTGGWQAWQTISRTVTLAAGVQTARLVMDGGGALAVGNIDAMLFTAVTVAASPAYGGTAAAVPGRIEAENFDTGDEGVAYHDATVGNSGGAYRSTNVDIQPCAEGGHNVGWTAAGEWLKYTVNVASSGAYTVQLRVASPNGGAMHVGFNAASNVWTSVSIPASGGWQNWTTVNVPVTLGAGLQQLTLLFDLGGVNLNFANIVAAPPPVVSAPASATDVSVLTWNIQIDDSSESHARVAMDMAMAVAPRPRVVVVQEAQAAHVNVYVDELQKQTGQVWHGVFAAHCALGQWTGTTCGWPYSQGVAIFTTFDIVNSESMFFPFADCWQSARAGLRAAVNVNGTVVQVFVTHLQHDSGCADDAQSRYKSMSMLKTWAAGFPSPQIVAGDFNAQADQIDSSSGMSPNFVDVWRAIGSGAGLTAYLPNPTVRIDYWFTDATQKAAPQSIEVIPFAGTFSDHAPVRATFRIP